MPGKPDAERKQGSPGLQKLVPPTAKKLGEAVEAAFLAKATMLGFPVLKPWGDSRPYDFAVESGRRLWRGRGEGASGHPGKGCETRAAGGGPPPFLARPSSLAGDVFDEDLCVWV